MEDSLAPLTHQSPPVLPVPATLKSLLCVPAGPRPEGHSGLWQHAPSKSISDLDAIEVWRRLSELKIKRSKARREPAESEAASAASAGSSELCCHPVVKRGKRNAVAPTAGPGTTHTPAGSHPPQKVPPDPCRSSSGHGREVSEHADR